MIAIDVLDKHAKLAAHHPGKLKSMWVLWTQRNEHSGRIYIRVARIARRQGHLIITEQHDRIYLSDAWVLTGDAPVAEHWPRYAWGAYESLLPSQADEVLSKILTPLPA